MRSLKRSDYLLGRKLTRAALHAARGGYVTVSAYEYDGVMRYTDPRTDGSKAGPGVKYRIRIRLKKRVPD